MLASFENKWAGDFDRHFRARMPGAQSPGLILYIFVSLSSRSGLGLMDAG